MGWSIRTLDIHSFPQATLRKISAVVLSLLASWDFLATISFLEIFPPPSFFLIHGISFVNTICISLSLYLLHGKTTLFALGVMNLTVTLSWGRGRENWIRNVSCAFRVKKHFLCFAFVYYHCLGGGSAIFSRVKVHHLNPRFCPANLSECFFFLKSIFSGFFQIVTILGHSWTL